MSWSLIAHTAAGGTSNSVTTSAIDTTGATLIVVALSMDDSPSRTTNFSDSKGNQWIGLPQARTQGATKSMMFYTKPTSVGSGHTFTNTGTNNFCAIFVQVFSGLPANFLLDSSSGNNVSSTTCAPGSITPSQDNELIVTHLAVSGAATPISIDASFIETDELDFSSGNYYGGAMAYLIQTTASAANPTWTRTNSNPMATIMHSFKITQNNNIAWSTA